MLHVDQAKMSPYNLETFNPEPNPGINSHDSM